MPDRTETADVVGCGPGGAVLAFLLVRGRVDVALVERAATFERVIALQRRAANPLAFWLGYGRYVPPRLVRGSAGVFGRPVGHSGLLRGAVELFAVGDRSVSVVRSHFE